ncbi:EEF1A lysine methyltransferase 1 [Phymastichus coffea]|uniref:EEF1A lysine methyltransferase 1 n=1 Tax=Phymastichus coffea TaxID=108790 RepID=UPI00273C2B03|nr:EEF1A lysine methyltransferase 1 [Phymastichus coffea]
MSDSDDEVLQLNPDTLAALNEFYQEREDRKKIFQTALEQNENISCDIDIEEDWQLSQFWYDHKTVTKITKGAIQCTDENAKIALISCPTLYKELVQIAGKRKVNLFEFDKRFAVFGSDFIFYDYNCPQDILKDSYRTFDLVICDPPFLSEECLTKTAISIRLLAKNNIVLCTGSIMDELARKLLGVKKCNFKPGHKNNLANEFWCYSNFDFDNFLI